MLSWLALIALAPLGAENYRPMVQAHRGHVLVVAFWATWCEPCREELPRLREVIKRGPKLVTISADEPEQFKTAEHFLNSASIRGPQYRLASGAQMSQLIDQVDPAWSGALPALFVYDASGRLQAKYIGEIDWPALERLLRPVDIHRQRSPNP